MSEMEGWMGYMQPAPYPEGSRPPPTPQAVLLLQNNSEGPIKETADYTSYRFQDCPSPTNKDETIDPFPIMSSSPQWSRLIRFLPASASSSDEPIYGEPIAEDYSDLGKLADEGKLKARVLQVDRSGPLSNSAKLTDETVTVGQLLSPLAIDDVTEVKCIGLNYKKHIQEGGRAAPPYPSLFIKPATAIAGYNAQTVVPKCAQANEADYEAEMCIVIGKDCKDVTAEQALEYVAGFTVGNDISSRKWQRAPERAGGVPQWCFSKVCRLLLSTLVIPYTLNIRQERAALMKQGFDGYCPIGPCIVSKQVVADPSTLDMKLFINGELRQETSVSDLLFDSQTIIAFLSQGTTLRRGTVIMTGTPSGVGCVGPEDKWRALKDGDKVEISLSEVGILRHIIKYE